MAAHDTVESMPIFRGIRMSEEVGDWAGHDIASFAPVGLPRRIEVKTTNGWERPPFHMTPNELAVDEERRSERCLFRL
jgi:hypothetical protein